jgi:hypothetical protein
VIDWKRVGRKGGSATRRRLPDSGVIRSARAIATAREHVSRAAIDAERAFAAIDRADAHLSTAIRNNEQLIHDLLAHLDPTGASHPRPATRNQRARLETIEQAIDDLTDEIELLRKIAAHETRQAAEWTRRAQLAAERRRDDLVRSAHESSARHTQASARLTAEVEDVDRTLVAYRSFLERLRRRFPPA